MSLSLRPYQDEAIHQLRSKIKDGKSKIILCMPTGSGKTATFGALCKLTIQKDYYAKVLILTDRLELLKQSGTTIQQIGLNPSYIRSGKPVNYDAKVWVGMVETFYSLLKKDELLITRLGNIKILICDEIHKSAFRKIIPYFQKEQIIIGATATPLSASKEHPLKNYFQDIVIPTKIDKLINSGYLSKAKTYGPILGKSDLGLLKMKGSDFSEESQMLFFNQAKIFLNMIENWQRFAKDKKTLIYCVNIKHAEATKESFIERGIMAECVTSETNPIRRDEIIEAHRKGEFKILVNCGILLMGYDDPEIECIIMNRATMSLPVWFQACGRGSRVTDNKKEFIIIDHGNNFMRHGLWQEDRDWEAIFWHPKIKNPNKIGVAPVKKCPQCESLVHSSSKTCEFCGYIFPEKEKKPGVAEFELKESKASRLKELEKLSLYQMTIRDISDYQLLKGYKLGWAIYQLRIKGDFESSIYDFAKIRGYKKGWAWNILNRKQKVKV